MKCRQVYLSLCEGLDQMPDSSKCRRIKKHLDDCPDCSAFLDSLKKTVGLYKRLPAPRVPPSARRRLLKAVNAVIESHGSRKSTGTGRKVW